MNEFISIKSLDKILYQRQPQKQNSCTPTSALTPNTSPNSRLRILSPTNKLDSTDKFNRTLNPSQQFKTMIKRDALKKKMNLLTAKLQTNTTEIIKEENAFSDRLLITSFENFVNETDQKLQNISKWISKSPQSIANSKLKIPDSEEQIENFEKKIIKTKQILQEKKEQLKYAKQQYQSNKQLLQQLKFELDQLNEDQKILEISIMLIIFPFIQLLCSHRRISQKKQNIMKIFNSLSLILISYLTYLPNYLENSIPNKATFIFHYKILYFYLTHCLVQQLNLSISRFLLLQHLYYINLYISYILSDKDL